jgi:NAD(P)-dependent dehydrogenase (short-subunit alcohol dehydrogenase family)
MACRLLAPKGITGVSSGFGRHLAGQLLARGDRVTGTVRQAEAAADLVTSYPDLVRAEILDVTDTAAIRDAAGRTSADLDRVDVAVGSADCGLFCGRGIHRRADPAHHRHQPGRSS